MSDIRNGTPAQEDWIYQFDSVYLGPVDNDGDIRANKCRVCAALVGPETIDQEVHWDWHLRTATD